MSQTQTNLTDALIDEMKFVFGTDTKRMDADWLVNIPEELGSLSREKLCAIIEKMFKTNSGRKTAKELYCK